MYTKFVLVSAVVVAVAAPSLAAPIQQEERSLKAIGTTIVGAGAAFLTSQALSRREVYVDTTDGTIYVETPKRSLTAIENFIHNLKREEIDGRSFSAINNAVESVLQDLHGPTGNLKREEVDERSLTAIENLIQNLKREEVDERSLTAIENFLQNLKREELGERSLTAIENFFKNLKRTTLNDIE